MACPVSAVQAGLNITADNVAGPQTRAAVATLQGAIGANADGYYWTSSGAVGPNTGSHVAVIQQGVGTAADQCYGPGTNGAVRRAQDALRNAGSDPGPSDGFYGPGTHGAVADFQSRHGLLVDGILGPQTGGALFGQPAPAPGPGPMPGPGGEAAGDGVDVSSYQGDIWWPGVRQSGYVWAIFKVSEGVTYHDPTASQGRVDALAQAGLVKGGYHFLRPTFGRTGDQEARFFLDIAHSIHLFNGGDIWPVCDFEATAMQLHIVEQLRKEKQPTPKLALALERPPTRVDELVAGLVRLGVVKTADDGTHVLDNEEPIRGEQQIFGSAADTFGYLSQFVRYVQGQTGCMIYVSPGLWNSYTPGNPGSTDNLGCRLWVANYFVSSPTIPVAWTRADAWQYADNGRVSGIGGNVDVNHGWSVPLI